MIRYVPPFILQKYADQEFEGQLNAYVVIFDIVDFTIPAPPCLSKVPRELTF
jgi:hypothetical protein